MTSPTAVLPRPRRTRVRAVLDTDVAAGLVASAVAVLLATLVLGGPSFVPEVSVTNPSDYDVSVQVSSAEPDGWMYLTTIVSGSTKTVTDVLDQGDVWVFRFRSQGRVGGDVRLTRDELERAGWTITVPDDVIDDLRRGRSATATVRCHRSEEESEP